MSLRDYAIKIQQQQLQLFQHQQAGYILLCVAQPKTDCVIDAGVESHDDLYRNPFAV